jgi:prefoldin subunit 5
MHQPETVKDKEENIERIQTQIEMIRQESRVLSYRIDRMMEQRKNLSEEKRRLKLTLETLSV